MIEYFFIIGIILIIGFLATILFERTRISTVLILMAFGFFLGPVFGIVDATEESLIAQISSFIATLALIILLFDGGMMLEIRSVLKAVPKSTFFTFLVFVVTLILVTLFCTLIGWDPLLGALLGAIVGGTSSAIVIAMAEKSGITREAKAFLTIESTITDALCIISAMIVVEVIVSATIVAGDIGHMFLAAFLIALFTGAVAAIVWLFAIEKLRIEKYYYMLTLAVAFIVYSLTEGISASGGFAVFIFGLTLGNAKSIIRNLSMSPELAMASTSTLKRFQEEVTFFVRTFFFVYAGLLLMPNYFAFGVLGVAFVVTLLALAGRMLSQKVVMGGNEFTQQDKRIVATTMPRGLAAAVLATTPAVLAVTGPEIPDFAPIVFGVIVFSNIVATFGVFLFSGKKPWGEKIYRYVSYIWDKLNAPDDELVQIEKKEKEEIEHELEEKKKKEERRKKKYEKKKKKVVLEELEYEVKEEEKELEELKKKIEEKKEEPH